jgi:hypothetical protein
MYVFIRTEVLVGYVKVLNYTFVIYAYIHFSWTVHSNNPEALEKVPLYYILVEFMAANSGVLGSIPGAEMGSTQPREDEWGATWKKK